MRKHKKKKKIKTKNKRNPQYERSVWWNERGVRKKLSQNARNIFLQKKKKKARNICYMLHIYLLPHVTHDKRADDS